MQIKSELAKIVGKDHVSDSKEECAKVFEDYSLLPTGMPDVVYGRQARRKWRKVVAWCNEQNVPVVPVSPGYT
jgi:FAD/FMN-containing dehydrogenase